LPAHTKASRARETISYVGHWQVEVGMDTTTLIIIVLLIVLLGGGGGYYGRSAGWGGPHYGGGLLGLILIIILLLWLTGNLGPRRFGPRVDRTPVGSVMRA
jgi:hypothetical protein